MAVKEIKNYYIKYLIDSFFIFVTHLGAKVFLLNARLLMANDIPIIYWVYLFFKSFFILYIGNNIIHRH